MFYVMMSLKLATICFLNQPYNTTYIEGSIYYVAI